MKPIIAEYDFKELKLKLVKNGQLNKKYNCLPYMITLPLSHPLEPLPPPNQPEPLYRHTIVKATTTYQNWLNFTPVKNLQPNIVTIEDNVLFFNKYSYHYEIIVDIINKGVDHVDLRFMSQNPISLLASNMNDINGNETVYRPNGQQIKFAVTGEYQFFYVHYPTTGFNINITINVYTGKVPKLICNNKCYKNCNCIDIKGNGFLKINNCEEILVPVYKTKTIGNTITKYIYPEFAYLRDLFYNITLANSLPPPTSLITSPGPEPESTILRVGITGKNTNCFNKDWANYQLIQGNLISLSPSIAGCPLNRIFEENNDIKYRYSWNETVPIVTSNLFQDLYFAVYLWQSGAWYEQKRYLMIRTDTGGAERYIYRLASNFYDNISDYQWIAFGIAAGTDILSINSTNNRFNMTITTL